MLMALNIRYSDDGNDDDGNDGDGSNDDGSDDDAPNSLNHVLERFLLTSLSFLTTSTTTLLASPTSRTTKMSPRTLTLEESFSKSQQWMMTQVPSTALSRTKSTRAMKYVRLNELVRNALSVSAVCMLQQKETEEK